MSVSSQSMEALLTWRKRGASAVRRYAQASRSLRTEKLRAKPEGDVGSCVAERRRAMATGMCDVVEVLRGLSHGIGPSGRGLSVWNVGLQCKNQAFKPGATRMVRLRGLCQNNDWDKV